MDYTTTKISRNRVAIYVAGQSEALCYLRPCEVQSWLNRRILSDKQDAEIAAERHTIRVAIVCAYLARRAARPKSTQLSFGF